MEEHAETLKRFRVTGTASTMAMLRTVFGEDDEVVYGAVCSSGPLGGDAQIAALMCLEDIGAVIFFTDPLSAHPHQADVDSLIRPARRHTHRADAVRVGLACTCAVVAVAAAGWAHR